MEEKNKSAANMPDVEFPPSAPELGVAKTVRSNVSVNDPVAEVAQVETISLSGTTPAVKQVETLTLSGSAAVKQVETLTLTGSMPVKQKETVTLSGSAGTANVSGPGGLIKLATFLTDLATTAANFVTDHVAAYLEKGIVVTNSGNTIVFEAQTAGMPFVAPVTTNVTTDLAGSTAHTTANVVLGTAHIRKAGSLHRLATAHTSLTQTAADFVTANAAAYLAQGIVLTSSGADLIFTAQTAGIAFTVPTITNATGNLAGSVAHTTANVVAGTANVEAAGGLTKLATFHTSPTQTATDFVTAHAAAYLAAGIDLTSSGTDLIFTAHVAGVAIIAPTITTLTGDLSGSVAHTTANVAVGTANVAGAGGLTKLATFNTSLNQTAADFVTAHAADYLAAGIVVTASTSHLVFTANVSGVPFTAPTITNVTGDLAGTVAHTTANVTDLSKIGQGKSLAGFRKAQVEVKLTGTAPTFDVTPKIANATNDEYILLAKQSLSGAKTHIFYIDIYGNIDVNFTCDNQGGTSPVIASIKVVGIN